MCNILRYYNNLRSPHDVSLFIIDQMYRSFIQEIPGKREIGGNSISRIESRTSETFPN